MCLRLEASGELETIRATGQVEGEPSVVSAELESPATRFDERIDKPVHAVLTEVH